MALTHKRYKANLPGFSLVLLLMVATLFYRLGSWGVIDSSEGRYAEISRKMVESGDYIHPTYLGIEHYHKPPMTYWITAVSYSIFGPTPFAARFFLQIAFLIQVILVFLIAQNLCEIDEVAIYTAVIYATFLIVVISIRNLTTDAYLNTFLLGATLSLVSYCKTAKPRTLYLFFILGAFAFLTKITAVFVYLGPVVLYCIWRYRVNVVLSWHILWASLVGLFCALSWFMILQAEGKEVLKYMLYDQSVVRYSSDTFKRSMPIYFYFAATLLLSFPWILLAVDKLWRRFRKNKKLDATTTLFLASFLLPILFFSLSHSKLLLYILPAFWVLAITSAEQLHTLTDKRSVMWIRIQCIFHFLILTGLLIAPLVAEDLKFSVMFYVWWLAGIVSIFIIVFSRSLTKQIRLVYSSLTFTLAITLMSTHFLSENELNASTGKIVVQWMKEEGLDNRSVYLYDKLAPSFAFHLRKDITLIGKTVKRELQFEQDEAWKDHYYDLESPARQSDLITRLSNSPSILVARKNRVHQIDSVITAKFSDEENIGLWKIYY